MGVINKTTEKINELLDKVEQGGSTQVEWNDVINKPTWVTSSTKPSYTASEVGAIPTGGLKTINGQSIEGKGNIEISGTGSGIPDAPADNEIYGRKNNNWEKIVSSGFPMFDANELVSLADIGESDLTPTLKSSIISAYENKAPFAFTDTEQLALLSIISKDTGYNLIMQLNIPYDIYGIYYVSLIADVNTTTDKITVTSNAMILPSNTQVPLEAPTDGKTYGRNNKKWVEITSSGGGSGSVQIVDISDLYEKYIKSDWGESTGTITQEDYNLLESYANNKDIICIVKRTIGGAFNLLVKLYADEKNVMLWAYDTLYGLIPCPCVYIFTKDNLSYSAIRQVYFTTYSANERGLFLTKYTKPETYTPIETGDSMLEALGKLEAGVSQGGGGGSVQVVDISEIYARYISEGIGEASGTMTKEDYDTLESYANNKNIICVVKSATSGMITAFVNLFADTSSLFIYFYDLFYGLLPTPIVYNVSKSDLTYTTIRQAVLTSFSITERNLYLSKYIKKDTYTPITTSDSVLEALGKLEAGISQGGGGIQAVNITDLISRLLQSSLEESAINDEDYALLEKYCAEHSMLYTMQDGFVSARLSLIKNGDAYQLEQIYVDASATNLQIQGFLISSLKKVKIFNRRITLS